MATCQETIDEALSVLRVIPMGRNASTAQAQDALKKLQRMVDSFFGVASSYQPVDVQITDSVDVWPDFPALRLQCQQSSAITITLPPGGEATITGFVPNGAPSLVRDGYRLTVLDVAGVAATRPITLAHNGWKIAGSYADVVLSSNGVNRTYMFRADLGDWKQMSDLTLTSDIPFPSEFDDGIAMLLAMRLEGSYGQPLGKNDKARALACKNALAARYVKPLALISDAGFQLLGGRVWPAGYSYSYAQWWGGY